MDAPEGVLNTFERTRPVTVVNKLIITDILIIDFKESAKNLADAPGNTMNADRRIIPIIFMLITMVKDIRLKSTN